MGCGSLVGDNEKRLSIYSEQVIRGRRDLAEEY